MSKSLQQLFAEPNDVNLCDGLFCRILDHHGDDVDASILNEAERVVVLVWHASGIIGNGGFRYLFELDIQGDPDFALTAKAFETVGCEKASSAVRTTLATFPGSRPPRNIEDRLRYYLKRQKSWPTNADLEFFAAEKDLDRRLASYIRSHADAFRHLEKQGKRATKKPQELPETAPQEGQTDSPTADLPRWARVAFAAHCARQVLPLLSQVWSDIPAKHSRAVKHAIVLAERSAEDARAAKGLEDAVVTVAVAAGAAFQGGAQGPDDAYSGTIASLVARAAEKAAESALANNSDDSARIVFDAWDFATSAADSADRDDISRQIRDDLDKLLGEAKARGWSSRSKVPSDIWSFL
ncbi:MAG: DUF4375 domain-containing protein [Gemmataceae bacterium]